MSWVHWFLGSGEPSGVPFLLDSARSRFECLGEIPAIYKWKLLDLIFCVIMRAITGIDLGSIIILEMTARFVNKRTVGPMNQKNRNRFHIELTDRHCCPNPNKVGVMYTNLEKSNIQSPHTTQHTIFIRNTHNTCIYIVLTLIGASNYSGTTCIQRSGEKMLSGNNNNGQWRFAENL